MSEMSELDHYKKRYSELKCDIINLERKLKKVQDAYQFNLDLLSEKERQLKEVMTGLTLIESSLINLRPRDNSPIDRRFGELIKEIVQLKEQGE